MPHGFYVSSKILGARQLSFGQRAPASTRPCRLIAQRLDLQQALVPSPLQFARHRAVFGFDRHILPLGSLRFVLCLLNAQLPLLFRRLNLRAQSLARQCCGFGARCLRHQQERLNHSRLDPFPASQLAQEYWYPVYDNATLDSQLRVSNVGSDTTHITVYAGGVQIDSYDLGKGAATRKNYPQNTGPLQVVSSTQPILTTIRLLYAGNSYYEMTGLPEGQLSTQYFFPWYNNKAMSSELRFAVP